VVVGQGVRHVGRRLGLTIADRHRSCSRRTRFGATGAPPKAQSRQADKSRDAGGMVEHAQQHGGHAKHVSVALRLQQFQQRARLGARGQHVDATRLEGAERRQAATGSVWNRGIGLIQTASAPVPIVRA
jgi:hypothetical protein